MCGIFVALKVNGVFKGSDFERFKKSLNLVSYRGPDATNFYTFNTHTGEINNHGRFNVFLGHNRLAIIDLSEKGIQPLTNDGETFIVFNGEIYNYLELKEKIKDKVPFTTNTDTEVVLNLYKLYGENVFSILNGMWAFVILDLRKRKLVLSRDRFSIKPLYYLTSKDAIFISSEIKQILPYINKEANERAIYLYLKQYLMDFNNETFFKKVMKVPAMHNIIIDLNTGERRIKKYWDYTLENVKGEEKDLVEEFRYLIYDSVRLRLRSDVTVINTLSGGLDSSTISVIANNLTGGKIDNFSVVSRGKFSEESYINILIRKKRIRVTKINFEEENPWIYVKKVIWHNDEPILTFTPVAHFMMMKRMKETLGAKVALSGQGGDEILMGYRKYAYFLLMTAIRDRNVLKFVKNLFNFVLKGTLSFSLNEAKRYIGFYRNRLNIIDKIYMGERFPEENLSIFKDLRDRQILDIDKYSVPSLTHYEDRTSMANSTEIRLPFLDYRIVNFCLNLPTEMKIKNGWSKYILRISMDELPNEIRWRKDKKGFTIPMENLLIESRKEIIEMFNNSTAHDMGIIDKKEFLKTYTNFLKQKNVWYRDILRFVFLEIWATIFFKDKGEEDDF